MPEKTMPNRKENRFMTNLMVVLHTLLSDREAAEKRLMEYGYRYAKRDIALLIAMDNRLQEQMLSTMPDRRIAYYQKMANEAQIVIEFPGAVKLDRHVLMEVEDLGALAEAAMRGECAVCIRDGREVKRCRLRDALLPIAPPREFSRVGCEYRRPASQLIQGEDVTI